MRYDAVCEICKMGLKDGVALYRTGLKGPGRDPHWRCSTDLVKNQEQACATQEVQQAVAMIEAVVNITS